MEFSLLFISYSFYPFLRLVSVVHPKIKNKKIIVWRQKETLLWKVKLQPCLIYFNWAEAHVGHSSAHHIVSGLVTVHIIEGEHPSWWDPWCHLMSRTAHSGRRTNYSWPLGWPHYFYSGCILGRTTAPHLVHLNTVRNIYSRFIRNR